MYTRHLYNVIKQFTGIKLIKLKKNTKTAVTKENIDIYFLLIIFTIFYI